MTTGPQAITRVSKETGIPEGRVDRVALTLQKEGADLWPVATGRGGGKNSAPVRNHHLVNLGLALGGMNLADPVTAVSKTVSLYRPMVPIQADPPDNDPDFAEALAAASGLALGTVLDLFVDMLARKRGPVRQNMFWVTMGRSIVFEPEAVIRFGRREKLLGRYSLPEEASGSSLGLTPNPPDWDAAHLITRTILPYGLFKIFGELWRDTLASKPPSLSSDNAEALAGASAPCRDQPTGSEKHAPADQSSQTEPSLRVFFGQPAVPLSQGDRDANARRFHTHNEHRI